MSGLANSASRLARRGGRWAGRRLLSSSGGADPSPPGSAASLLELLDSHRGEWDPRLSPRARWQQERRARGGRRGGRLPGPPPRPPPSGPPGPLQRHKPPPFDAAFRPGERPDWHQRGSFLPPPPAHALVRPAAKARPQKTAAALGLSHDRRSREITARVVAAYAYAEAQLGSAELGRGDKVAAARRCVLSFRRLASLPLSDINLSAMMHRACRLATHDRLRAETAAERAGAAGAQAWYPDLGQEPLLRGLWAEVVARARLQLSRRAGQEEEGGLARRAWAGSALGEPPPGVHSSTAAMAVWSIGAVSLSVPPEELDAVAQVVMADRERWSAQRVVMVALALGRLGAQPLGGALHAALVAEAAPRLGGLAGEEISTLLWGLGHAGYHPGDAFITAAAAAMAPWAETLRPVGVLNALDGLSSLGWVLPPPPLAEIEGLAPWTPAEVAAAVAAGGDDAAAGEWEGGEDAAVEDGRIRVRDLRELQSLAREWERERRRGLAALLQEEGGGDGTAAAPAAVPVSPSVGALGFSLEALAQQALRARAERDSGALLRREADRIARELRAAVASRAAQEQQQGEQREAGGGGNGTAAASPSGDSGGGRRAEPIEGLEDDEVLVERLLTGAWPQRAAPAEAGPGAGAEEAGAATARRGHGRRILRLGPLLAEAMVHPDSGVTVIQPHYDRDLLWGAPPALDSEEPAAPDGDGASTPAEGGGAAGEEALDFGDDLSVEKLEEEASAEAAALEEVAAGGGGGDAGAAEELGAGRDGELPAREEASAVAAAGAAVTALVRRAAGMLPALRPDQATTLARHATLLRHLDPDFMLSLRAKITATLDGMDRDAAAPTAATRAPLSSICLADFLWSFASLGVPELMPAALARRVAAAMLRDPECSPTALARCAWALAVLGHLDGATMRAVGDKLSAIVEERGQGLEGLTAAGRGDGGVGASAEDEAPSASRSLTTLLTQVYQAALAVEMDAGEAAEGLIPEALRGAAAAAWHERAASANPSSLQRQVAGAVRASGRACALEHVPPGAPVVIDIALFDPGEGGASGVALEVDGPSHFATNRRTHPLGATRLRDALLRHCGWSVATVPYFEWIVLQGGRQQGWYLETKIQAALRAKKPGAGQQ